MKKILTILTIGLALTIASSFAYATVSYVMNKTISQSVTVGNTAVYTDGITIELATLDSNTLTFFEIDESETMKHYITYTYNYEILVSGMNIEVSSLSNDIVVSELIYTDTTIAITFSLNQENEYVSGSIIHVQFYFEAVEKTPVNINTATMEELLSVGFTEVEATEIVALTYNVTSLDELYNYIYIADIHTRFDQLVIDGIIVFE